jgi:hypothetical protein
MYAMLWVLASGLAWLTFRLSRRPSHRAAAIGWVLAGAAGLLTHYFFVFVWLACLAWLFVVTRPGSRGRVGALVGLTLLLVLPWYAEVPTSLNLWRVTAGWQNGSLEWPKTLGRPFLLAASLLSGTSPFGGWRWADRFTLGLFVVLATWAASQSSIHRLFGGRRLLLWLWLAASCLGLLAFDLLLHTTTSYIDRYVLPALPAAMLLAALVMSQLPRKFHVVALSALLLAWLPSAYASAKGTPRPWEPFRQVGARLESWARPGDVVLVHSIPVGVVGVARYVKRDIPIASWVVRLGLRQVPADLQLLLTGHRRVALVKIHYLHLPSPAEVAAGARTARSAGHLPPIRRGSAVLRAVGRDHVFGRVFHDPCRCRLASIGSRRSRHYQFQRPAAAIARAPSTAADRRGRSGRAPDPRRACRWGSPATRH